MRSLKERFKKKPTVSTPKAETPKAKASPAKAPKAKDKIPDTAPPVANRDQKPPAQARSSINPIELRIGASPQEKEQVIQAVYRQVLGNIHVMDSQRLVGPESQFKSGELSVREFVRAVAKSKLYRTRFVEPCSRTRTIELNFKHLLGRAPNSFAETYAQSRIDDQGGFEADIDSYIDSDEYQNTFGENIVPYPRGAQSLIGRAVVGYTHWASLSGGAASSDTAANQMGTPQITQSLMSDATEAAKSQSGARSQPPAPVFAPVAIAPSSFTSSATPTGDAEPWTATTLAPQKSKLRTQIDEASQPLKLWPTASEQECQQVIQSIYRQVLGNAYVMKSERLSTLESQLRQNEITVREFVRQLAKSPLYTSRFVNSCSRIRTIELNFKHLLGRAPLSYDEFAFHGKIYDEGGFEAEIDSYIDSVEYESAYGDDTVPFDRGYLTQPGQSMVAFTHWSKVARGPATSNKAVDRTRNASQLHPVVVTNTPTTIQGASQSPPASFGLIEFKGLTWEPANPPEKHATAKDEAAPPAQKSVEEVLKPYTMPSSGLTWQSGDSLSPVRPNTNIGITNSGISLQDILNKVPVAR